MQVIDRRFSKVINDLRLYLVHIVTTLCEESSTLTETCPSEGKKTDHPTNDGQDGLGFLTIEWQGLYLRTNT